MNKTSKSSDPQKAYNYAIRLLTAREIWGTSRQVMSQV